MMQARLYTIPLSHSAAAARLMLEYKGVEHATTRCLSGLHPVMLRLAGFSRGTVPALRVDGRRVQGSLEISRCLDALCPEPPLFPPGLQQRRAVETAEAWGENVLQPVPRRLFRWALVREPVLRRSLARVNGLPLAGTMAMLLKPLAWHFARLSEARDATVRRHLAELPGLLDHADGLVQEGLIGPGVRNAAAFQIAPSLDLLTCFEQLASCLAGRPSVRWARQLLAAPGVEEAGRQESRREPRVEVPAVFPAAWLP
ncbi:MAG: glutathione S-transferase N-terminal domain-containing protein [Candidatus Eiseniibacteriota bacterium]|jgi:glutathione S-transferase